MSEHYVLIVSRDPYTHGTTRECYDLAFELAGGGRRVTLFLAQNGVLPVRPSPSSGDLEELVQRGVRVVAEELSLRERGIGTDRMAAGVDERLRRRTCRSGRCTWWKARTGLRSRSRTTP